MLKNEVGRDGAAPALEQTTRNEGLLTEFNNAITESTMLKVVGGAALLAGGVAATAAAVKFGKPLLGLGKAVAPEADEAVLTAIREAGAGGKAAERPFMMPATDALVSAGKRIDVAGRDGLTVSKFDPLAAIDPYGFRFALAKPGETGVLSVTKDGGIEAGLKATFKNRVPINEKLGFKEVDPNIPIFGTMDDIKALMPHPDSPNHRVVMKLDGVARDVSVTDAISILSERAIRFVAANPGAASKALADRMPRPMIERDISAMTGRMAQALDAAKLPKV